LLVKIWYLPSKKWRFFKARQGDFKSKIKGKLVVIFRFAQRQAVETCTSRNAGIRLFRAIARRAKAIRRLNSEAGRSKTARTTKATTVAKTVAAKFACRLYALDLFFRTPA